MAEYLIPIKLEPLEEGGYLATSRVLQGLIAQGRTVAETMEIAQDVARKLIESCLDHGDPLPEGLAKSRINKIMRYIKVLLLALLIWGHLGNNPAWADSAWHTLVIDPGHGGNDLGIKGSFGLLEKDVTLKIADKLAQQVIKRLGVRVVLTRDKDEYLSWSKRVGIANNNKADLFISLHAGADNGHAGQGMAFYVLTGQNWPANPSLPSEGDLVLWDYAQQNYLSSSLILARAFSRQAQKNTEVKTRGVYSAPLFGLKGATMPAVMIEVGYLTHPQEEEKLLKADYQELLANIIINGLLEYKKNVQGN
ncbi:MAG: N-acetylmuramoyl-L-alanine amidase [Candidatus Schekmanbacteria bacterium]|nr:N-acetylmuramoyl-L-alanine amidase [Candidatus Schekmanbacteria bacterium]